MPSATATAQPPIESRHNRPRSFRAGSSCAGRRDHRVRRRAPPARAQRAGLRWQAVRRSKPHRETRMPGLLAEFAPGASRHPLESFSLAGLLLSRWTAKAGPGVLLHNFSPGRMVATVGERTKTPQSRLRMAFALEEMKREPASRLFHVKKGWWKSIIFRRVPQRHRGFDSGRQPLADRLGHHGFKRAVP